jgi:hypothetical protein
MSNLTPYLSGPYKLENSKRMDVPSFDPMHAVRFDLRHGSVCTGSEDERVLLVPIAALDDVALSAPPEAVEALGRALGSSIGRRAAARLGDPGAAAVDAFVTQLAGEAAIAGVGALSIERWGRALVVVVADSPLVGALLAPLVASAVEAASGRSVACALLSRDEQAARILVGSASGVARVKEWIASGMPWGEALVKLHGGAR